MSMSITINPKDIESINDMMSALKPNEVAKSTARGINKTMTGVRTDGTKILTEHYALTATAIRNSWKIRKALFKDPNGVVSTKGTFIRLKEFGAKQVSTGVSVKVLKKNPRKIIKHAFITKLGLKEQVYWRKWHGEAKKPVKGRAYAKLPFKYRFPIQALYGPRIQDHLGDPTIMKTLEGMAGTRLEKNMKHEVEYLLRLAAMPVEDAG